MTFNNSWHYGIVCFTNILEITGISIVFFHILVHLYVLELSMMSIIIKLVHIIVQRPAEARLRVWNVLAMMRTNCWASVSLAPWRGLFLLYHIFLLNFILQYGVQV